jgi:hypothetical protein
MNVTVHGTEPSKAPEIFTVHFESSANAVEDTTIEKRSKRVVRMARHATPPRAPGNGEGRGERWSPPGRPAAITRASERV